MKDIAKTTPSESAAAVGLPTNQAPVLLEASALAGAATGAAVGVIGGPPGIILGGAIGTAMGLLAGSALELANERAGAHDRALDDDIGVTAGDLGAREAAASRLNDLQHAALAGTECAGTAEFVSAAALLRAEHARLDAVYERLLTAYRQGDWRDVREEWNVFEPALRAHMETEEKRVFPVLREVNADEAEALIGEHDELRKLLEVLGVHIELHALAGADADELVRRLRAHGAREERLLYPWIDATFQAPVTCENDR
ncbi:MAG TPA: hemerythrin domain-containing protein [Labilithrix sp.]|nr:hemerythrin domain-containing protein [Labilithrix sp.]